MAAGRLGDKLIPKESAVSDEKVASEQQKMKDEAIKLAGWEALKTIVDGAHSQAKQALSSATLNNFLKALTDLRRCNELELNDMQADRLGTSAPAQDFSARANVLAEYERHVTSFSETLAKEPVSTDNYVNLLMNEDDEDEELVALPPGSFGITVVVADPAAPKIESTGKVTASLSAAASEAKTPAKKLPPAAVKKPNRIHTVEFKDERGRNGKMSALDVEVDDRVVTGAGWSCGCVDLFKGLFKKKSPPASPGMLDSNDSDNYVAVREPTQKR